MSALNLSKAASHSFALGALAILLAALLTPLSNKALSPPSGGATSLTEEFKALQGHWEGDGAGGKCSVTIIGNSLEYRNSAGWYKTTFTLPPGTEPKQLHATIKEISPPSKSSIGKVVLAIYKIENETLFLAEFDGSDQAPKSFGEAASQYKVKRVKPQAK
jgi:hypothetical protein